MGVDSTPRYLCGHGDSAWRHERAPLTRGWIEGWTECEIPVFHKLFAVLAPANGIFFRCGLFVDLRRGLGVEW